MWRQARDWANSTTLFNRAQTAVVEPPPFGFPLERVKVRFAKERPSASPDVVQILGIGWIKQSAVGFLGMRARIHPNQVSAGQ